MNSNQLKLLMFYCWQLKIKTFKDLAIWKARHNATTNAELLQAMAKAYNGKEWLEINGLN